tara:strand:+ start:602 stop:2158 length:1557 start_codon:yes stop_codon:yes gene_type:complete
LKIKSKNYLIIISIPIILGIITSLSLPPFNYLFLNFITLPLFLIFFLKNYEFDKIKSFIIGWSFGFGYFISNLYWLVNSLTFDENFKPLIPFAFVLLPLFIGLFYGLITLICCFIKLNNNFNSLLIFASIFSIIEFIRGIIFGGFPWNYLVFSLSNYIEFIQILKIIGTDLLNFLVITIFLVPSIFFLKENLYKKISVSFVVIIVVLANYIYGVTEIKNFDYADEKKLNSKIKIISPKIEIERYLYLNNPIQIINELIQLSKPNLNEKTIFIFPEGTLTGLSLSELKNFKSLFTKNFSKNHKIILGINSNYKSKIYNSLAVINDNVDTLAIYSKNKLVPFGEFLPFENLIKKFGFKKITQGYQSFSPSKNREVIKINDIRFLPLICYEIIYSGNLNKKKEIYDLILNISEDGWFKNSIGLDQHFSHSKFRAIEEGKNLIRVANNGTSAFINPTGEIEKKIESTDKGVFEVNSFRKTKKTIFSTFGNKLYFYFMFFYITLIFFLKLKGRNYEKKFFIHK